MVQKKDKKILKRISAIVCAFALAIVAFSFPYMSNLNVNKSTAYASSEGNTTAYYTYNSSNYQLGYSLCDSPTLTALQHGFEYGRFKFSFSNDPSLSSSTNHIYFYLEFDHYVDGYGFVTDSAFTGYIPLDDSTAFWLDVENKYLPAEILCESGFDFYPVSLLVGSVHNSELDVGYNKFVYTDIDGDTLTLFLGYYYTGGNTTRALTLEDRTYYLVPEFTADYEQGYVQGQSDGYNAGYADGEMHGYSNGYDVGESVGYNNGYTNGANAANEYTFFSLISSVIDAPIQAFMGLFNFELLGINLAGFFTGLLTLAFIITIVRLVMP